jgi:hypothetical protein
MAGQKVTNCCAMKKIKQGHGLIKLILHDGKGFSAKVDEYLLFWLPDKTKIIFS